MKLMKKMPGVLGLTIALGFFGTTQAEAQRQSRTQDVVDRLAGLEQYSTLVTAVQVAGLVDTLKEADGVTIFAPTNDAFAALPDGALDGLIADPTALAGLLTYHVVGEKLSSYRLRNGSLSTLLPERNVEISRDRFYGYWWLHSRIKVNDSNVVEANIRATNGIIHGIDAVLMPDFEVPPTILDIAKGDDFTTLASLVEQAGFARALDSDHLNLTVFAPTNAAFEALPQELLDKLAEDRQLLRFVLKNHIVRGSVKSTDLSTGNVRTVGRTDLDIVVGEEGITVDGANVIGADNIASNGVVHVIDQVLVPEELNTLLAVISAKEELATFKVALETAGYDRFFDRSSRFLRFTLFAPNNAAFAEVGDALAGILADQRTLRTILNRHIAFRQILAGDLEDGQKIRTIGGVRLEVDISDSGVTLNGAPVLETDLKASNGVLHVVGSVIPAEAPTDGEDPE